MCQKSANGIVQHIDRGIAPWRRLVAEEDGDYRERKHHGRSRAGDEHPKWQRQVVALAEGMGAGWNRIIYGAKTDQDTDGTD